MTELQKLYEKKNLSALENIIIRFSTPPELGEKAAEELSLLHAIEEQFNRELHNHLLDASNYEIHIKDLEEEIKKVEANYDALQTPMPCGHLARYAVTADEGTSYCALCQLESCVEEK